ncbi:hypothetical protein P171DRAFT_427251 [Karstenula rhodostoma CBS 690.94]|uniref:Uncharacterized protein n=1 Tax=Karstenula rhodostoma CBS 690.94 TaxID=1392251 RepID=A0A9P4UI97_9PLEO|nr:hypothetical protein P171DRAFT_427251 [Karstenula rhodostoma CBS 690.94]
MPPAASHMKDVTEFSAIEVPAGDTPASGKTRFTRAEKRKFARENNVVQAPQAPKKSSTKPKDDLRKFRPSKIDVYKLSPDQIDTYIALLEAKAKTGSSKPTSLADRVTRDHVKKERAGEKLKKELSVAKLEKIEKRIQLRIAKKIA